MVDLDSLRAQIGQVARIRVVSAAQSMTNDLKRDAPVGATGETRRKTGVELVSDTKSLIKAEAVIDVEYAEIIVGGSRPHVIRGNPVLAFRWPKRGPGMFFFRKVNHPGTAPNPFFTRITARWGDYLRRAQ